MVEIPTFKTNYTKTMEEKAFYKSKTFWFNGITLLVTVAVFFGYTPNEALAQTVKNFLMAVGPIINILLRIKNNEPLGLGAFKQE